MDTNKPSFPGRRRPEERRALADPGLKEQQRIKNSINAINALLKQFS